MVPAAAAPAAAATTTPAAAPAATTAAATAALGTSDAATTAVTAAGDNVACEGGVVRQWWRQLQPEPRGATQLRLARLQDEDAGGEVIAARVAAEGVVAADVNVPMAEMVAGTVAAAADESKDKERVAGGGADGGRVVGGRDGGERGGAVECLGDGHSGGGR